MASESMMLLGHALTKRPRQRLPGLLEDKLDDLTVSSINERRMRGEYLLARHTAVELSKSIDESEEPVAKANSLINLALLEHDLSNFERAISLYSDAINLLKNKQLSEIRVVENTLDVNYGSSLTYLAFTGSKFKDYFSEPRFRAHHLSSAKQVLSYSYNTFTRNLPGSSAFAPARIAEFSLAVGEKDQARSYILKAKDQVLDSNNIPAIIETRRQLARIDLAFENPTAAMDQIMHAYHLFEQIPTFRKVKVDLLLTKSEIEASQGGNFADSFIAAYHLSRKIGLPKIFYAPNKLAFSSK